MILENLKGVWKNQKESIQFSEIDIYKMIHKKSTSLVKWIFYISILEFVLFMLSNFLMDIPADIEKLHLLNFINISIVVSLVIGLVFIYLFYKNYKRICVSDSTKKLMTDILRTKKTVNYYIIIQLIIGSVVAFTTLYRTIIFSEETRGLELTLHFGFWLLLIFIMLFIMAILWLFYKLLYGILLNRLKDNYKELQKNE